MSETALSAEPRRRGRTPRPAISLEFVPVEATPQVAEEAKRRLVAALASLLDAANEPT